MLNSNQKEKIRNINIYRYSCSEADGKPIDEEGKEFVIPSFSKIEKSVIDEIYQLGFSKVERVSPFKANCIIRVFKKLHYERNDEIYNVYGAKCYTLKGRIWITNTFNNDELEVNYSKHETGHWICQDESVRFDCDFFDCYVKIS